MGPCKMAPGKAGGFPRLNLLQKRRKTAKSTNFRPMGPIGVKNHPNRRLSITFSRVGTPTNQFLGPHKTVPQGFRQFCKANLAEKGQIWQSSILTGPRSSVDPAVGSHSVCVLSWDTLEGIQALYWLLGTLEIGFWVPARWLRARLAVFLG